MKKIFALVLSLCLVLSSFVAVSAAEQVYNEGVWNEGTDSVVVPGAVTTHAIAGSNFENGVDGLQVGNAALSASPVTRDDGNAVKITATEGGDAYTKVIGFEILDGNGNAVNLNDTSTKSPDKAAHASAPAVLNQDLELEWSLDVMMTDTTVATPQIILREGGSFAPSGRSVMLKGGMAAELTAGEWKTFSGKVKLSDLTQWEGDNSYHTYATIRTYFAKAGDLYIDNFSIKIETKEQDVTEYRDYIVNQDVDFSAGVETVQVGNTGISGAVQNGALLATATAGTGAHGIVGLPVVNTAGEAVKVRNLDGDATIEWSVDVMFPDASKVSSGYIMLRDGNFVPTNDLVALKYFSSLGLQNNEWKTISGKCKLSELGWSELKTGNTFFAVRPNFSAAGTMYVDNMSIKIYNEVAPEDVVLPGWDVAPGWGTPDCSVPYTLAPKNVAGTLEDGVYTVTSAQLKAYAGATTDFSNCSANDWLKIIPTELNSSKTIKVSFDIKAENLVNSEGNPYAERTLALRIRTASNGNVVAWNTYTCTVPVNTGDAERAEFVINVADIPGTDHFGVNVDMQNPLRFGDGTEYFEISNVSIEEVGTKLDYEVVNGNLVITNNNDEKYKFDGRIFFAEYLGNQLVQFYAAGDVAEEIEAGSNVVIENAFENPVENNVKIFVWETGSMVPAMDPVE